MDVIIHTGLSKHNEINPSFQHAFLNDKDKTSKTSLPACVNTLVKYSFQQTNVGCKCSSAVDQTQSASWQVWSFQCTEHLHRKAHSASKQGYSNSGRCHVEKQFIISCRHAHK